MNPIRTKEIQIVVNGQVRHVPEGLSLALVLAGLEVAPGRVAVELDRRIIRREDWSDTLVAPGAVLEIVQFVGGG
jgi:sulfur carrier protein